MAKREVDVLVFYLLEAGYAFDGLTNYQIARKLRTTPNKVKNLKYESKLRFDNAILEDESYLLIELKKYFEKPIINLDQNWLYIQIENPMLMDALRAKLKEGGTLYDGSFNSELVKLSSKDYGLLLDKLIFDETDIALKKEAMTALSKIKETKFSNISKKIMDSAIKKGGDVGLEFIINQTQKLLSGRFSEVIDLFQSL